MINVNAAPTSLCTCDEPIAHTLRMHPSVTIWPTLYSQTEALATYEDRLLVRSTIVTPAIPWLAQYPELFNPQRLISRAYTAELEDPEPPR